MVFYFYRICGSESKTPGSGQITHPEAWRCRIRIFCQGVMSCQDRSREGHRVSLPGRHPEGRLCHPSQRGQRVERDTRPSGQCHQVRHTVYIYILYLLFKWLTLKALKYIRVNRGDKSFFQFEIIINVLGSSLRFIWILMSWVYDHYNYTYSHSAGIDFTDVWFWRLKSTRAL